MSRCWTDIETNGLLKSLTKLYCAVIVDENDQAHTFRNVEEYLAKLQEYDHIVFHNGINFDAPALEKLAGRKLPWLKKRMEDTLVLSRLLFADITNLDFNKQRKFGSSYPLPVKLLGSHSLKAWGLRLGCMKGDFNPADYLDDNGVPHTWETVGFSQDMLDYNIQDCVVTKSVWDLMQRQRSSAKAIKLEYGIAWLMAQQERNGFPFNTRAAQELYAELGAKRSSFEFDLKKEFGWWYAANGKTVPKRTLCYKEKTRPDLTEGAAYTKIKVVEFNPGSRAHIAKVFKDRYGWEPNEFTESGEPKLDSEVLEKLPFKEAPALKDFFDINKMIGQLGDGRNAWLRLEEHGVIYGSVNPNGAGTGRATHSRPNVAQVPKGPAGSYGHRCRELFTVPPGWLLLGTDASGLELRGLANRLAPWDKGSYANLVVNGDVHWHNTLALGLVPGGTIRDKDNPEHEAARDTSKRWIYAFLYGAGDELLGEIAGYTEEERAAWREANAHIPVIKQLKRRGERVTVARISHILKGSELRKSFLQAIPAVKEFQKACKKQHKNYGGVIGLDGRFIKTRSQHSATNFQLQGDGALVCKLWGVLLEEALQNIGLKHGWDGDYAFCAWVHDEYQIACRNMEVAQIVGKFARETMKQVGKEFKFECPLDAEFDIGTNWSETH